MPAKIIPGTGKTFFLPKHIGDFEINLENYPDLDDTLKQEDVLVIGNWTDYTGSGQIGPQNVLLQGLQTGEKTAAQELAGEETIIEATDRGKNSTTHRQRNKIVYIEV